MAEGEEGERKLVRKRMGVGERRTWLKGAHGHHQRPCTSTSLLADDREQMRQEFPLSVSWVITSDLMGRINLLNPVGVDGPGSQS